MTTPDYLKEWWVHETKIKRLWATGGYEDEYEEVEIQRGFYDGKKRMVVSPTGAQVMSSATVYYPLSVALIPVGSLVTAPESHGGDEAKVIGVGIHDAAEPKHMEVILE